MVHDFHVLHQHQQARGILLSSWVLLEFHHDIVKSHLERSPWCSGFQRSIPVIHSVCSVLGVLVPELLALDFRKLIKLFNMKLRSLVSWSCFGVFVCLS